MRHIAIATLIIFLAPSPGLAGSDAPAGPPPDHVSVHVLKQAISAGDELGVSRALSTVRQRVSWEKQADPEIVAFLWDLWSGHRDRHPDVKWQMLDRELIMVMVASALVFFTVRGVYETDLGPFRAYARNLVPEPNLLVSFHAMGILEMIDDPDDVPLVYAAATEKGGSKFRAAALTLGGMCNAAASDALARLRAAVETAEERSFIDEQVNKFGGRSRQIRGCD